MSVCVCVGGACAFLCDFQAVLSILRKMINSIQGQRATPAEQNRHLLVYVLFEDVWTARSIEGVKKFRLPILLKPTTLAESCVILISVDKQKGLNTSITSETPQLGKGHHNKEKVLLHCIHRGDLTSSDYQ